MFKIINEGDLQSLVEKSCGVERSETSRWFD